MSSVGPATATDIRSGQWTRRVIDGDRVGCAVVPEWLVASYAQYRRVLSAEGYPCYFGVEAESKGDVYYSFAEGIPPERLPCTLATFCRIAAVPDARKSNLAVFFRPPSGAKSIELYEQGFWQTLRFLALNDPRPEAAMPSDPENPLWEFTFAGMQFFVVGACPAYSNRNSRNLGPGLVMLFQPRSVFTDGDGKPIGMAARRRVRDRLAKWDALPAHPFLGIYGDPDSREWRQYFLPDDSEAITKRCPLSHVASVAGKDER